MRGVVLGAIVALVVCASPGSAASAEDWDIPGGHFFTQTGGGAGKGYAVTDADGIPLWSEFKRVGGVPAVGYPASQRFRWDGFVVQVFQRVVLQWRPEAGRVSFVNVFDRLHDLGRDEFLVRARQVPPPRVFDDAGKSWEQVVAGRLAALETHPAIKAKYFEVVGDPVEANGLPVSDVTDMGNHYALRAQRVVLQQWKEDVPWARKGQVTVALGGDVAKEAGILPQPDALLPVSAPGDQAARPSLMGIEQVVVTGRGTVVVGRVERGRIRVGDEVEVVGPGRPRPAVVAGVEILGKAVAEALPGDRAAVLLRPVELDQVRPGHALAQPGTVAPEQAAAGARPMLMTIEEVFASGRGTVVAGRVERGRIRVGDEVEVVGPGRPRPAVVAGVEILGKAVADALAGDRAAVLLRPAELGQVRPGHALAQPGSVAP